jgi:hypothetical protein
VFDIFTAIISIGSLCALLGTICKTLLAPPKVWDEIDCSMEELESAPDYDELRKENPHIWID